MATNHQFTEVIFNILEWYFNEKAREIFKESELLQYVNLKTKSANSGAKSRWSFANLYALYVVIEDYLEGGFDKNNEYKNYIWAEFTKLFRRQRELPFGAKLQNHALNNRMNAEFQKFFPNTEFTPILRNLENNRYWINENLLLIEIGGVVYNISEAFIEIIDEYARTKKSSFEKFIQSCEELQQLDEWDSLQVRDFIIWLLAPNIDARLFEIVSYAILKYYYFEQQIYWWFSETELNKEKLSLYKTWRTNANDGWIDFVMKPLWRFFQVTETLDVRKYFLDIDKIQKFPITFVIKTLEAEEAILAHLKANARKMYLIENIVNQYMACIEEVINITTLQIRLDEVIGQWNLKLILNEIILQSKVEFNYNDDDESSEDDEGM